MRMDPGEARPRAVVIGAGLGGLASAMRLGAKGYDVTVLDRLDTPGGRGSALHRGGHRFDLGPTIVTVPALLRDLWAATGRDFDSEIDLRALDPFYEIRWPDGSTFTMRPGAEAMREEVRRLAPGDLAGFERFLEDAEARYQVGFVGLGRRPMHRLSDMLKVLPTFARLRADRSLAAHAAARVRDPRLRMALSFHPLFIGGDPFRVTSMYALVSHLEAAFGVHYAIGGVARIAERMAAIVREQGGRVRQGVEVDRIRIQDGRARGVTLTTGERVPAEVTVSNADPGQTYDRLLRDAPRRRWTPKALASRRWSMGVFVWYFGTRGTRGMWEDVGHHTIINGPRYRGLLDDIFIRGRLAEDMSLYLHRPAVTDPTVAPAGDDTFYVLSPVPHLGWASPVNWEREEPAYRERVAAVLDKAMPGFRDRIVTERVFTPETFRQRYLSPHGAGFSLEPRILQSAWFRPHNVSEEARGLYLVGAGTHPGAGLPGVVSSAEVLAKMVPDLPARDARLRMAAE